MHIEVVLLSAQFHEKVLLITNFIKAFYIIRSSFLSLLLIRQQPIESPSPTVSVCRVHRFAPYYLPHLLRVGVAIMLWLYKFVGTCLPVESRGPMVGIATASPPNLLVIEEVTWQPQPKTKGRGRKFPVMT